MKYKRYGSFKFQDFWISWLGILVLLLMSVVAIILKMSFFFLLCCIGFAAYWMWKIICPFIEEFSINGNTIITQKGKVKQEISIPSKVCLIVSYADIVPPFAIRTSYNKQTHILKNKYAITILRETPLNGTLESLHRNHIEKYTMSSVENVFYGSAFVYSFVCSANLLDDLLVNRTCQLIIPESLLRVCDVNNANAFLYVDHGY